MADGPGRMPSNEHEALFYLASIGLDKESANSESVLRALIAEPWLQDGVTDIDWGILVYMGQIARRNPAEAVQLLGMPFMETTELMDYLAIAGLEQLAREGSDLLPAALAAPWLRGGITDQQTHVVSHLNATMPRRPDLTAVLLDPSQTVAMQRTIDLPLAGEMVLIAAWPGRGATPAKVSEVLDHQERIMRFIEAYMDAPWRGWPEPYMAVTVADSSERHAGIAFDYLAIHPDHYDDIGTLTHESAHVYWNAWPRWISDGGATFMDQLYVTAQGGAAPALRCSQFNNLQDLENADLPLTHPSDICHYALGSALFHELRDTLGDEAFRPAWTRFYQWLWDDALELRCGRDAGKGICYANAAFVEYMSDHADTTAEILRRHFYGN